MTRVTGNNDKQQGWLRRISADCWKYRRDVLLAFGASLGGMAVTALVPLMPRVIIDDVIVGHTKSLGPWAGLLIVAAVAVYGLTYLRRFYGGRLALDVQHDLRTEMFATLTRLDGASQDELDTGQVVGRATSDLQLIQGLLFMLPMMIGNLLLFVISLVVMACALPAAHPHRARRGPRPVVPRRPQPHPPLPRHLVRPERGRRGRRRGRRRGHRRPRRQGLRPGGAGDWTSSATVSRRLFAGRLRTVRLNARYTPALQAVPALGQVAMLALGGWMAVHGQITLGTFVAFSTYLAQLTGPVRMLDHRAHRRPAGPGRRRAGPTN